MDYTRLTQTGRWSGTLAVEGKVHQVDQSSWRGARDHSWGIRPVGDPDRAGAPARDGALGFFWNWAPVQFDGHAVMYTISENHDGSRWHEAAARLPSYGSEDSHQQLTIISHDLKLKSGTRLFDGGTVILREPDQSKRELVFEPLSLLHMACAGYDYSGKFWRHAQYHGPLAIEGQSWDLSDPAVAASLAGQNEVVCKATYGGETGYGIFEFILFGLYQPYGFASLTDVAP
jgi:hypothetical protein